MRKSSLAALLVFFAACSHAISGPRDVGLDQSVELRAGQSAQVSNTPVVVTFVSASDSRCPSDVQCVQAGEALIRLQFSGAGADKLDSLRLVGQPHTLVYGEYRFEGVTLLPYPVSTAMNAEKTLTLKVSRAN